MQERDDPLEVEHEWAGKLVLIPAEMWPDFACDENGGAGCAPPSSSRPVPSHRPPQHNVQTMTVLTLTPLHA